FAAVFLRRRTTFFLAMRGLEQRQKAKGKGGSGAVSFRHQEGSPWGFSAFDECRCPSGSACWRRGASFRWCSLRRMPAAEPYKRPEAAADQAPRRLVTIRRHT